MIFYIINLTKLSKKNYETRVYEKTKYMVIKYKTTEKVANKNDEAKKSDEKQKKPNDQIMGSVWRLMKYTQGDNKNKIKIKFYMPVFVRIKTEPKENGEKDLEVRIMVALPPEYQSDNNNANIPVLDPPEPNEQDIEFEVHEEFKCYVR